MAQIDPSLFPQAADPTFVGPVAPQPQLVATPIDRDGLESLLNVPVAETTWGGLLLLASALWAYYVRKVHKGTSRRSR